VKLLRVIKISLKKLSLQRRKTGVVSKDTGLILNGILMPKKLIRMQHR